MSVVDYLIKELKCDPTTVDFNEEDCLTLSIKEKQTEVSNYLVNLGKFNLKHVKERSGFNYFAYAVVKGQFETATVMYDFLQKKNKATDDIINPVIKVI